jgi:hypothetical protein
MADGMCYSPGHLHTAETPQPIWLMEHIIALAFSSHINAYVVAYLISLLHHLVYHF